LHHAAIFMSALLLVYHQVTTLVPIYPWNDVEKYTKKELLLEAGFNGVLMGTGLICLILSNSGFSRWYPILYYPFLFVGECFDWWIPYFSESFAKSRRIWNYEAHFARTVKWIPHRPGKRTPDANHIVLHLLTIITILMVYLNDSYLLETGK
jgi:hypothetical protein